MNEYRWSRVPTYEGGRKSKRSATSKGGAKQEPPEEDNMYDCFSDDNEEDEKLEDPEAPTKGCPLIRRII